MLVNLKAAHLQGYSYSPDPALSQLNVFLKFGLINVNINASALCKDVEIKWELERGSPVKAPHLYYTVGKPQGLLGLPGRLNEKKYMPVI